MITLTIPTPSFNPRLRVGGDLRAALAKADGQCFNPRLPRRRRQSISTQLAHIDGFNPHLPRRRVSVRSSPLDWVRGHLTPGFHYAMAPDVSC
jgi:hypothetical protein